MKTRVIVSFLTVLFSYLFFYNIANAMPVVFGSNAYELIFVANPNTNNKYDDASTAAGNLIHLGVNGHLVTITSEAENNFLSDYVAAENVPLNGGGFKGAWIGGRTGTGWLAGPETGNPLVYTNYGGSEPNNNGFIYMAIALVPGAGGGLTDIGQWLDDSGEQGTPSSLDPVIGYIVEYENVSAIPVPAALPLFGTGLALMGFVTWRRKRKIA